MEIMKKKQFTLKIQSQYHIVFAQNIDEKRYKAKWKRYRRNFEEIMQSKGSRNNRSRSVSRAHTYAGKYPTAHKYSTVYGISQGKK